MDPTIVNNKPHAVLIPYPLQGHINPVMKLAQLLHKKGFYITILNTEFIHKRLFKNGPPSYLPCDFNLETYPDELLPASDGATPDLVSLCVTGRHKFSEPIRNVILRINNQDHTFVPKVSCVISDPIMPFVIDIADEIGVPSLVFWTASACSFMVYLQYLRVNKKGPLPISEENKNDVIDWVPGLKNVRLGDLSFVDASKFDFPMKEIQESLKAKSVIINTFDSLEHEVLGSLSSMFSKVYAIGPLNDNLKSIKFNFWEQEHKCLQWLDTKEPKSVIYISFGSLITISRPKFIEFAWGIMISKFPFVWVIRENMVTDGPVSLPPELLAKVRERGFIAKWCPQEDVLNHPSIGGFVTHCGWNSMLDTLCSGVPIICWPGIGDQVINCRYSCKNWGIGMDIGENITRDAVEKIVRELMNGEEGEKVRMKAREWKTRAIKASSGGGSSSLNIEKLVKDARN